MLVSISPRLHGEKTNKTTLNGYNAVDFSVLKKCRGSGRGKREGEVSQDSALFLLERMFSVE